MVLTSPTADATAQQLSQLHAGGHKRLVQLLLSHAADPPHLNHAAQLLLLIANIKDFQRGVSVFLLLHGATVSQFVTSGRPDTPLSRPCRGGHDKIVLLPLARRGLKTEKLYSR